MNFKILKKFQSHKIYVSNIDSDFVGFDLNKLSGYYFNNSLHFYGYDTINKFDDVFYINEVINKLYSGLNFLNFKCFGEDLFGNQFVCLDFKYYLFNIETCEIDYISDSISKFISTILSDPSYYSGNSLTLMLTNTELELLSNGYRMSPKRPFVLGGEYENSNLFINQFINNLELNNNIAKQIFKLNDGQVVEIERL